MQDGHVAEVEHGDILPGVEIFFHGPGGLDVGGFLHRRVKAHGEAQRQDGLAAQIHRTFCDVQRQHPALRGLGRGDDRAVFEAADSLQGHELRVTRADADAVKSAYPFFHSSSSSFAVLVWPSGPYWFEKSTAPTRNAPAARRSRWSWMASSRLDSTGSLISASSKISMQASVVAAFIRAAQTSRDAPQRAAWAQSSSVPDMTREERIKILEALKESDTILEKSISGSQLPETQHYIEGFDLPPLSVFMDAVIENATVKRAQSQVEQVKNQYRIEKRNWWNYFRLNGNYAYGRYNVLNDNSDSYNDWYQSTTASSRYTFNVGASFSVGLGDLFNRPLRLKNYRYNIEQLQYTQEEVMEERRLKVLEAYNNVTAQLATIKAKAENAALYNAQMKISENNFIQGKIDIISLSLERARRSGAVTSYAEARVSLHNAIILLEMLTNVKIIKGK